VHRFQVPDASDSLVYQRVQKLRALDNNMGQSLSTNYDLVTKLYNSLIESADGFCIGGNQTRCTEANKADWVDKIPFQFKWLSVRQLFRDAERKNA
jgi:hypothetical protein